MQSFDELYGYGYDDVMVDGEQNGTRAQISMNAMMHMMSRDYEAAKLMLIDLKQSYGLRSKDYSMLTKCHLLTGEFEEAYRCYKEIVERFADNIADDAYDMIEMFEQIGYGDDSLYPSAYGMKQAMERSDESYADVDEAVSIMESDEYEHKRSIDRLEIEKESHDPLVRAHALFTIAELFILSDHKEEALGYYQAAIRSNPNYALYWGYMAQIMNQLEANPIESGKYVQTATQLDPKNARWRFVLANILFRAASNFEIDYIHQSIIEYEKAIALCRPDQGQLKHYIQVAMNQVLEVRRQVFED